jgi:hypothetical protein
VTDPSAQLLRATRKIADFPCQRKFLCESDGAESEEAATASKFAYSQESMELNEMSSVVVVFDFGCTVDNILKTYAMRSQ